MTDKEIINRLGGVKSIADFFGWKYTTVHNWVHRGIPYKVKVQYKDYFMIDDPKPLNPSPIYQPQAKNNTFKSEQNA